MFKIDCTYVIETRFENVFDSDILNVAEFISNSMNMDSNENLNELKTIHVSCHTNNFNVAK